MLVGGPLGQNIARCLRRLRSGVYDRALFQIDVIFVWKESSLREHRRFSMFEPENVQALT